MKTIKTRGNLLFACQDNLIFLVVVASFPKVCVFNENDPSTRQGYHIVSKSFHFGVPIQKLSFSVKTIDVFDRFHVDAR